MCAREHEPNKLPYHVRPIKFCVSNTVIAILKNKIFQIECVSFYKKML